jgi:hypothetical protein
MPRLRNLWAGLRPASRFREISQQVESKKVCWPAESQWWSSGPPPSSMRSRRIAAGQFFASKDISRMSVICRNLHGTVDDENIDWAFVRLKS